MNSYNLSTLALRDLHAILYYIEEKWVYLQLPHFSMSSQRPVSASPSPRG